ncbi:MAG: hypothetical protein MZV65_48665 [Chromatiales bacterium]|nr:hypothetical protein [Chromatiales bacterium]
MCLRAALVSLLRKLVPQEVRIATYIVIIATFVTVVDYADPGGQPGALRRARRLHPAHRRELHHPRPRRGARLEAPAAAGR